MSLVAVLIVHPNPTSPSSAALAQGSRDTRSVQQLSVAGGPALALTRDGYTVTKLTPPAPAAPRAAGVPDPGSAKAIAREMVAARGWGVEQYDCLVALWQRESNWNVYAENPSSGAYGIPQSLPGSKMATAGADWRTNAATQITWGLGYIQSRYGTPCGAWAHSESHNWY